MTSSETPSSLLLRAAARMREDAERCGDSPDSFIPAVASWLESEAGQARSIDSYEGRAVYPLMLAGYRLPLAVARAYLGEAEAGRG